MLSHIATGLAFVALCKAQSALLPYTNSSATSTFSLSSYEASSSSSMASSMPFIISITSSTGSEVVASQTASLSSVVGTATPSLSGSYETGDPEWHLSLPGDLIPWTSVLVTFDRAVMNSSFAFSDGSITVGGVSYNDAINITDTTVNIELLYSSIPANEDIEVVIAGTTLGGTSWTADVTIELTTSQTPLKLIKRDVLTYKLSETIVMPADVITSTTVTDVESTTVLIITSCSDNACATSAVTTGVTVITLTEAGEVTEYTTYCPLTDTTSAAAAKETTSLVVEESTTIITIMSCSNDVCTENVVTTGVAVLTSTYNGELTTYTEYLPLTSSASPATSTVAPGIQAVSTTTLAASTTTEAAAGTESPATSEATDVTTAAADATTSSASPVLETTTLVAHGPASIGEDTTSTLVVETTVVQASASSSADSLSPAEVSIYTGGSSSAKLGGFLFLVALMA